MKFYCRMALSREERNTSTFCLSRAAGGWGRGNCAYAEEDAHHAFASGRCQPFFCTLPKRRLELPSLHHVSPSASLLALRAPPLTLTSSALLQAQQKVLSLQEKQMRNREKNPIIFSKEDKEMWSSSCLPCLRELLCIQGLARVENDAVVSQRTHVELNLWLQDKCLH